jgi:hypothetical protein
MSDLELLFGMRRVPADVLVHAFDDDDDEDFDDEDDEDFDEDEW